MNDSIINVGDELVVRIAGYPVSKAEVVQIDKRGYLLKAMGEAGETFFILPPTFTPVDEIDGVDHTRKVTE